MIKKKFRLEYKGKIFSFSTNIRINSDDLLVFIHGLGCTKESFNMVWKSKELKNFSIITVDLIGFGESSKPQNFSYDLNAQAELCKLLLKKFQQKRVHIIGNSMGGPIGLLLTEKILPKAKSFINVEGALIKEDEGIFGKRIKNVNFDEFKNKVFDEFKDFIFKGKQKSSKFWLRSIKKSDPLAFYKSLKSLTKTSNSEILLKKFKSLKINKAYIYGEKDSDLIALKKIKGIKKVCVSKSGHFVMIDNPNEFYNKLSFLISKKRQK